MEALKVGEKTSKGKEHQSSEDVVELMKYDDMIGHKWFFRTVTYHLVGLVVGRMGSFLILSEASWVASSGRFMQAIKEGDLDEVEPVGMAGINLEAVTDFFPWKHALPEVQK
jgi:hypothetical protein